MARMKAQPVVRTPSRLVRAATDAGAPRRAPAKRRWRMAAAARLALALAAAAPSSPLGANDLDPTAGPGQQQWEVTRSTTERSQR
jgi:hypothetical protein